MDNDRLASSNVVSLDGYKEEHFEDMLHCECGSNTFFVVRDEGLVCLECDGRLENFEVTQTDGGL